MLGLDKMSVLFSPISIRGLTVANRIFVSPMCQYSAENGAPNNWPPAALARAGRGRSALTGSFVPRKRVTEVRETTRRLRIFASSVIRASVMPSAKYS